MIDYLQRIASILTPVRPLLVMLGAGGIVIMVLSVVDNPFNLTDDWLIPGTMIMLWSICLCSLSYLFQHVPGAPDASMHWRERWSRKLRRLGLWLLGLLFVGLSLMTLLLSYQLLRVYFM